MGNMTKPESFHKIVKQIKPYESIVDDCDSM